MQAPRPLTQGYSEGGRERVLLFSKKFPVSSGCDDSPGRIRMSDQEFQHQVDTYKAHLLLLHGCTPEQDKFTPEQIVRHDILCHLLLALLVEPQGGRISDQGFVKRSCYCNISPVQAFAQERIELSALCS